MTIRFTHILCLSDLTEASDLAIQTAHERANTCDARLTFLNVLPIHDPVSVLFPHFHKQITARTSRLISASLRTLISACLKNAVDRVTQLTGRTDEEFTVVVESGAPDAIALEKAQELDCDFIVTPKCSWTKRMIRHADCPVLVVKTGPLVGGILAATDLSDPLLPAIAAATGEAQLRDQPLIAFFSLDLSGSAVMGPEFPPQAYVFSKGEIEAMTCEARGRLNDAMKKTKAKGEPVIHQGPPADGILKAAVDYGCSLIVMGATGRAGLPRFLLGSTAETVLDQAPCSVLVVRLHND